MHDGSDVLQRIQSVVARVFDVHTNSIHGDTKASDVDGWDSVSHAILLFELEQEFGVNLEYEETMALPNLDALAAKIRSLIGSTKA